LRRLSRREAALASVLARWIGARAPGERLARLVGAPVRADVVASSAPSGFDPWAARCEVRVGGAAIEARGSSLAVRAIAQRVLGGPAELGAPRPLGVVEKSLWSLVVATALEDLGVAGEVWPLLDDVDADDAAPDDVATRVVRPGARGNELRPERVPTSSVVELAVVFGDDMLAVQLHVPADLALRVPPPRSPPAWFDTTMLDVPIVLGRCALGRRDLERLAVRSVVTLERPRGTAELAIFAGAVGLRVVPGAVVGEVATGYGARDMSLPDDAHVELSVQLGTTQLSLRQLGELAIGQIVQLGRPLAGPFELRAEGRVVGRCELVEVDGELAVRIVSIGEQE
jgi:flagellar motor switch/type III secretory pathway protein FliN